jgi:hypothetical protein
MAMASAASSGASAWSNFRGQHPAVQALVWVCALPVPTWLWARQVAQHRGAAMSFAGLVTVACLVLPVAIATSARPEAPSSNTTDIDSDAPTTSTSTTSTSVPTTGPPATSPSTRPPPSASVPPAPDAEPNRDDGAELLRRVRVADELDDAGYDRALFSSWVDDDGDGCDTRCEVLAAERIDELPGLPAGGWRSVYDGIATDDPSQFDIDHLVALGEAWRSGAAAWDPARRDAFANDLDDPRTLIAVSAASNRSKGDNDPSQWRPPIESHWCAYATDWLAVKVRWDLAVDPIEFTAVQFLIDGCA